MNIYPHLRGRRGILDLRCSKPTQANTSLPDQDKGGMEFCRLNGVIIHETIKQTVTASIPGARSDFEDIIQKKQNGEDFDLLIVTDVSRFTRAGVKHGFATEYGLEVAGIEVVFAMTDLPQGEDADLVKPSYYFAAKQWVKSQTEMSARGWQSALEAGRVAHCTTPPYGLDFLYVIDGKPSHITRLLSSGKQLKLHPDAMGKEPSAEQILAKFPKNPKLGKNLHYKKQANEKVLLVPGAPDALRNVIMILMLAHKQGWRGNRIAGELNTMGIVAPRGGLWNCSTIDYLLRNKTYLGTGLANTRTRAVYATRQPNWPKKQKRTARELATRKLPSLEHRPSNEWIERQYPNLDGFLDPELHTLALRFVESHLKKKSGGHVPAVNSSRINWDSKYLLSKILTSKQGGHGMSGTTKHAKGRQYAVYRISKFHHAPKNDVQNKLLRRTVRADQIEPAILKAIGEVLRQMPDMRKRLAAAVREEQMRRLKDHDQRAKLILEQKNVEDEYNDLISLGKHGRELAKSKIARCERRLEELATRVASCDEATGACIDPTKQADEILTILEGLPRNFAKVPTPLLKRIVRSLVSKLEIDLTTLNIELELALPNWALLDTGRLARELCPNTNLPTQTTSWAQPSRSVILGAFRCSAVGRPVCFSCCRQRAAA